MSSALSSKYIIPLKIAHIFYAAALIAWGTQQFIFGFFIAGRPVPWPQGLPGETLVAYASGALLIITGITIIVNKKAAVFLVATSIMILLWAGLRDVFFVVVNLDLGGNLTNMGKALTIGSAAMLIATTFRDGGSGDLTHNKMVIFIASCCRYFAGLFLLFSGIQHFMFAQFVKFLIPEWIPAAEFWVYFSGVALAAAGLGLITGIKARLAATLSAWMIFIWLFTLHLPRAIVNANQNEWTAVFEALAVSGILFVIADDLNKK